MQISLSFLQVFLGSGLLVVIGGAGLLILLASVSRNLGDDNPIVGGFSFLGQSLFVLAIIAAIVLL